MKTGKLVFTVATMAFAAGVAAVLLIAWAAG